MNMRTLGMMAAILSLSTVPHICPCGGVAHSEHGTPLGSKRGVEYTDSKGKRYKREENGMVRRING